MKMKRGPRSAKCVEASQISGVSEVMKVLILMALRFPYLSTNRPHQGMASIMESDPDSTITVYWKYPRTRSLSIYTEKKGEAICMATMKNAVRRVKRPKLLWRIFPRNCISVKYEASSC